ncbi:MAG: STAS/SEC14 domain-containing protein [Rhodospirillales bacterium]|nr:MAG: STAS/SEC14 domain-containing protein [Rhodospirillales bacterium]
MLKHELRKEDGILIVRPEGPLSADDFEFIATDVDAHIEAHGKLNGLMIHARRFPGWEDLWAVMSHLKFVREHHRKIRRVAVVSDSAILQFAPKIATHFVSAELRQFPFKAKDEALAWLGAAG